MSVDPRNTIDNAGTNPNKGLNTRPFMITVIAALLAILLVLFLFARRSAHGVKPVQDGRPSTPQSHLDAPSAKLSAA